MLVNQIYFIKVMNINNFKKTTVKILLSFCVVLTLSSCVNNKRLPPCPGIYLEKDTVSAVFFKDDIGKDITDKIFEVEVTGYEGYCNFSKDLKTVEVKIHVLFDAALGGAASSRDVNFDYFVAIPSFYPEKEGKQIFNVGLNFPEGVYYVSHRDEEITLTLPMPQTETAKDLSVFVGIQLNENQLEYNRQIKNN